MKKISINEKKFVITEDFCYNQKDWTARLKYSAIQLELIQMLRLLNVILSLALERKQNCPQVNSYTGNIENVTSLVNVKENELNEIYLRPYHCNYQYELLNESSKEISFDVNGKPCYYANLSVAY